MSNGPLFSGKRTDDLIIKRYVTHVKATPKGLVLVHAALVIPSGANPGTECKTLEFAVPVAQQDDLQVLESRWRTARDQLRQAYALEGRLVDLDIRIPMHIVRKKQGNVPDVIKEILNEDSAPEGEV